MRRRVAFLDPVWIPPDLEEEIGEFERIVDEGYVSDFDAVMRSAAAGKLVDLDLEDPRWRNMEDADSGQDLTMDDVRDAANLYGRDVDRILAGMESGSPMPAPIILEMPDGSLHNVAGNTRLMVCRALGVVPEVWWVKHPDLMETGKMASRIAYEGDDLRLQPGIGFYLQPDGEWGVADIPEDILQGARFSGYLVIRGYRCAVFELAGQQWAQKMTGTTASLERIASRIAGITRS